MLDDAVIVVGGHDNLVIAFIVDVRRPVENTVFERGAGHDGHNIGFGFTAVIVFGFDAEGQALACFDGGIGNAGHVINIITLFLWVRVNNMTIVVGVLRAGGDTRFSLFLDGIIIWIVGVPMAYIGANILHLPVYLVYLCAMSEETAKWILGMWRYRSRKWINNLAAQVEGI